VSSPASSSPQQGLISFARQIISNEGLVKALWLPGISANALGMGMSAALRLGYYERVRDGLICNGRQYNGSKSSNKNIIHMAVAGAATGLGAYFITSPLHLIKTLNQIEASNNASTARVGHKLYAKDLLSGFRSIIRDNGILGLWRGTLAFSLRGSLFTSGQMLGYDGFKTICKSNGVNDDVYLHICSSLVAAVAASFLSTPADLVASRSVAELTSKATTVCATKSTGILDLLAIIYKERGIFGFWRGNTLSFVRIAPVTLTYSALYEQIRHYFGLGYLS